MPPRVESEGFVDRWRAKQLEYSWTSTLMRRRATFEELGEQALDWTLGAYGIQDEQARETLLRAYRDLPPHDDAVPCLGRLRARRLRTAVLSNGSEAAIADALDRSGLAPFIDDVLSVEPVGAFKPDPAVYRFAAERLGVGPAEIAYQTANAWDAAGAAAAGFRVHWINRRGSPDEYGFRGSVPDFASLDAVAPVRPAPYAAG